MSPSPKGLRIHSCVYPRLGVVKTVGWGEWFGTDDEGEVEIPVRFQTVEVTPWELEPPVVV